MEPLDSSIDPSRTFRRSYGVQYKLQRATSYIGSKVLYKAPQEGRDRPAESRRFPGRNQLQNHLETDWSNPWQQWCAAQISKIGKTEKRRLIEEKVPYLVHISSLLPTGSLRYCQEKHYLHYLHYSSAAVQCSAVTALPPPSTGLL